MSEFIERAVDFTPLPEDERAAKESDGRTLEGYAAVFDADTEINSWEGHFKERISRGAFRKTLRERTPVMQFNHGHDARFGSLPIGTFESIREDKHGLKVEGRLFEHAEPIREAIASGAVTGMSFKFRVVRDSWADNKGTEIKDRSELLDLLYGGAESKKRGPLQRTIKEVKMTEAGPVVFPAYTQTTVGVRSAEDMSRADREALYNLAHEGEGDEEREDDFDDEGDGEVQVDERAFPPADDKKKVEKCSKCTDEKKCAEHAKKTSSGGEKPKTEKKSEDDTSVAPEEGADAVEPRSENPDDAAQAGTSTGLSKNARERAMRLLGIER